jgi:glutathione synthase
MEELVQMNKLSEAEKTIPENILQEIIMYLYTNGLIIKSINGGVNHIPIMLTPSPIPKNIYEKIFFYQIAFNKIIDKLSNDQNFLEEILTPISEKDSFVKKNLEISKKLVNYEHKQKIKLGIFRNDYLFDKKQNFLFFTEYNTIASSMGTFSDKMKKFYSYFSQKYTEIFKKYSEKEIPLEGFNNIEKFAESIYEAIKLAFPQQYKESIIVFIIQKKETNIFDQYSLSDELYNKYKITSKRITLEEIKAKCNQDENGNLTLDSQLISLFYFRAGYTENDYPNEESWLGRELIELSTAIKVPDINTFLTTFKIFQYELSKPQILMRYCHSELIINDILRFFGGIYNIRDMSSEKVKELFSKIKAEPTKYILKPMKEGGGNNITGDKLKDIIPEEDSEISDLIKNSVIVEKIESYEHEGLVIRNEKLKVQNSISEFSIYGIILTNENKLIINKSVSFLVRTKDKESIEGGIIEGAGAIDIPCLLNIKLETQFNKKVEISAEEIQKYLDDLKAAQEAEKKEEEEKKKVEEEEEKKKVEEEEKKKEEKAEE